MNEERITANSSNIGSLIVSAFFVLAGAITLYDTSTYTDIDSKVFPQAAAILLIVCSSIAFVMTLLRPSVDEGFGRGVWWRRVLLVVTMLLTCFAMPYVGFLAAGVIAFIGGLIAAMHDRWSAKTLWLYWGSGAVLMVAFYSLFRYALHVPLP
jgi:hypothetical protein